MKKSLIVSLVLGATMATSAVVAAALTPHVKIADMQAKFNLEDMVPRQFGEWRVDETIVPLQVDPETQAKLNRIYNQVLARTYINRDGERIMLSLAYGGDQGDNMGVHKPEICYAAQGFEITRAGADALHTDYGNLPLKRLMAVNGARYEPITYWITIGNKAVKPGLDQRLTELKYGLTGTIPDGMLVRISNISRDPDSAYKVHDRFVQDMLHAMREPGRTRLIGAFDGA
jgi:EpsI family protein